MLAFLARLVAFMIAVSVIRHVVDYIRRLWHGSPQQQPLQFRNYARRSAQSNSPAAAADDYSTLLQQDPVCGTYVAPDTSIKKIVAGHVYHFCSSECRAKFSS